MRSCILNTIVANLITVVYYLRTSIEYCMLDVILIIRALLLFNFDCSYESRIDWTWFPRWVTQVHACYYHCFALWAYLITLWCILCYDDRHFSFFYASSSFILAPHPFIGRLPDLALTYYTRYYSYLPYVEEGEWRQSASELEARYRLERCSPRLFVGCVVTLFC
jgi:hypothetical protein